MDVPRALKRKRDRTIFFESRGSAEFLFVEIPPNEDMLQTIQDMIDIIPVMTHPDLQRTVVRRGTTTIREAARELVVEAKDSRLKEVEHRWEVLFSLSGRWVHFVAAGIGPFADSEQKWSQVIRSVRQRHER